MYWNVLCNPPRHHSSPTTCLVSSSLQVPFRVSLYSLFCLPVLMTFWMALLTMCTPHISHREFLGKAQLRRTVTPNNKSWSVWPAEIFRTDDNNAFFICNQMHPRISVNLKSLYTFCTYFLAACFFFHCFRSLGLGFHLADVTKWMLTSPICPEPILKKTKGNMIICSLNLMPFSSNYDSQKKDYRM